MTIKEIFDAAEDGKLTYEQFQEFAKSNKAKFADISEGNYVSKKKYEDEMEGLNDRINTLNETIETRNLDLEHLQQQLEEAGNDVDRLGETLDAFSELQNKYDADTKAYQDKLSQQAYQFAVKEFANTKKFTSNAARRDFIQAMESKGLQMDKDTILGAEDFVKAYAADNSDAFVEDKIDPPEPSKPTATFVQPTPGGTPPIDSTGGFANAFHFTGVREIPTDK